MAMQSNCNGSLTSWNNPKKNNGSRKQGCKGNLNFQILREEKCEAHALAELKKFLCRTDPVFSPNAVIIHGVLN